MSLDNLLFWKMSGFTKSHEKKRLPHQPLRPSLLVTLTVAKNNNIKNHQLRANPRTACKHFNTGMISSDPKASAPAWEPRPPGDGGQAGPWIKATRRSGPSSPEI